MYRNCTLVERPSIHFALVYPNSMSPNPYEYSQSETPAFHGQAWIHASASSSTLVTPHTWSINTGQFRKYIHQTPSNTQNHRNPQFQVSKTMTPAPSFTVLVNNCVLLVTSPTHLLLSRALFSLNHSADSARIKLTDVPNSSRSGQWFAKALRPSRVNIFLSLSQSPPQKPSSSCLSFGQAHAIRYTSSSSSENRVLAVTLNFIRLGNWRRGARVEIVPLRLVYRWA